MPFFGGQFIHGTDSTYLGSSPNNDRYLGTDSPHGYIGIFRTGLLQAPSSGASTSDFMTVYSSGHWGQQPMFDVIIVNTYYRPCIMGWRFIFDYNALHWDQLPMGSSDRVTFGGNCHSNNSARPSLYVHNDAGSSTTLGVSTSDSSSTSYTNQVSDSSNNHSGQPVYKQNIGLSNPGAYHQTYAIIKIFAGGGSSDVFFSNSSVSTVDANRRTNGSGFHFKTISSQTNYHNNN